ncbi:unnamed protein product [Amaranthus hypochondriacus]
MEKQEQKLANQIALIPSPGLGHLIPFIEFAKLLISNFNLSITLLLPSRAHDQPNEAQISLLASLPNGINYVNLPPIDFVGIKGAEDNKQGNVKMRERRKHQKNK